MPLAFRRTHGGRATASPGVLFDREPLGAERLTAPVVPPQVVVTIGEIAARAVVSGGGVHIRTGCTARLTVDHRIADHRAAARLRPGGRDRRRPRSATTNGCCSARPRLTSPRPQGPAHDRQGNRAGLSGLLVRRGAAPSPDLCSRLSADHHL
ncbi:2-oxo acid dehydrogenase subunit E2 [Streptomyces cavernae]|uniref:2-oxo acid dehydrogenase subunit E2 n=1 Tax=Streptomyces cavernae TaxID=2259034 RepID=UPI000FEBF437